MALTKQKSAEDKAAGGDECSSDRCPKLCSGLPAVATVPASSPSPPPLPLPWILASSSSDVSGALFPGPIAEAHVHAC